MQNLNNQDIIFDEEISDYSWQLLQIFNFYRFLLSSLFLFLDLYNVTSLGGYNKSLYIYTIILYLAISILFLLFSYLRKPHYNSQVILQIFMDIMVITMIMHFSGGMHTGLGMLLIPVIAAASIITPGKVSFLYTAMASIAVLSEQVFAHIHQSFKYVNYTEAGLAGITLFATAFAINILSRKLSVSEALSKHQTITIAKLEQINTLVIQKIHTGVILIDESNNLYMANIAAQELLKIKYQKKMSMDTYLPELAKRINKWREEKQYNKNFLAVIENLKISAEPIFITDKSKTPNFLIFIENLSEQAKKVQDLKLVSIGRLTANIAHEIRNPLGAISHAAQLLNEALSLNKPEQRILDIIKENTERTNNIIESILNLSKTKTSNPICINIQTWLENFVARFINQNHKYKDNIFIEHKDKELKILADPTPLYQIFNNLSENGIRYSIKKTNKPYLLFKTYKKDNEACIEIVDKGPGIDNEHIKYLFEPFFTTDTKGTGLGLFIARELCQTNDATLNYYPASNGGSCFRIIFSIYKDNT